jgi:hypothetical protein
MKHKQGVLCHGYAGMRADRASAQASAGSHPIPDRILQSLIHLFSFWLF